MADYSSVSTSYEVQIYHVAMITIVAAAAPPTNHLSGETSDADSPQ